MCLPPNNLVHIVAMVSAMQSDLQQLLQMFAQAVTIWRNMVSNGASLDYASAAEMITSSEAMSRAFLHHCQKVM